MRKIFLLAILAIVAVAFSSCDSPKFFIDHQVAYCGEQVEMTQNSQINVEYETIAFIWLYGQSGNCEIVTKYSKEEPPQKNFDDITNNSGSVFGKKWRQITKNDLTQEANNLVLKLGGEKLINVKFDIDKDYSSFYKLWYTKGIIMTGEVVKKRNNN